MAKNKQKKKKERERRVAQKKFAAAAAKRTQEQTTKEGTSSVPAAKRVFSTDAVPKVDFIASNRRSPFTQRRGGG